MEEVSLMTLATLRAILGQYGGGGNSGTGGGGYSALYWVIVAVVALVILGAVAWAVNRFRARRRASSPATESRKTDRAA